MTEHAIRLLEEYAVGRAEERRLRAAMRALRCEVERQARVGGSAESPEPADDGEPPCYADGVSVPPADWCESCRTRDPLFHQMVARRRANKVLLRRLERAVLAPVAPPPADEPKLLLDLMTEGPVAFKPGD